MRFNFSYIPKDYDWGNVFLPLPSFATALEVQMPIKGRNCGLMRLGERNLCGIKEPRTMPFLLWSVERG